MAADRISKANYNLYQHLPSQLVSVAIVNYFKDYGLSGKFGELFGGNVFAYRRDDTMERVLPSANVFPLSFKTKGDMGYINGTLRLEFNLPVKLIRARQTEAGVVIGEALFLLTRNPQWLITIGRDVPALKELASSMDIDYSPIYPHDKDSLMFFVDISYQIDIASYFDYLNENGYDTTDPAIISDMVTGYKLILKEC